MNVFLDFYVFVLLGLLNLDLIIKNMIKITNFKGYEVLLGS